MKKIDKLQKPRQQPDAAFDTLQMQYKQRTSRKTQVKRNNLCKIAPSWGVLRRFITRPKEFARWQCHRYQYNNKSAKYARLKHLYLT